MNEQFALILTELQKLNTRVTNIEETMATKNDIVNMATKDDIANMATKDDIANMATKDDIADIRKVMATKDDIADIRKVMVTKDDIADLPFIRQAVLETNDNVKLLMNNQRIIFDQLERHEIAIRNLNEQTSKILKVIRV